MWGGAVRVWIIMYVFVGEYMWFFVDKNMIYTCDIKIKQLRNCTSLNNLLSGKIDTQKKWKVEDGWFEMFILKCFKNYWLGMINSSCCRHFGGLLVLLIFFFSNTDRRNLPLSSITLRNHLDF